MVIVPNGNVRLLNTKLDNKYQNQILFPSQTAQTDYFTSLTVHNFDSDDVVYIQKDNVIRVNKNADQLYNVNYIMYQNKQFSNRWFYGFVNKVEWLSDQTSNVYFSTDVWQTWHFDLSFKPSFVMREHVADDTVGKHTVEEGLEIGDYIISKTSSTGLGDMSIMLASSIYLGTGEPASGKIYQGIYSGDIYTAYTTALNGINKLNADLKTLEDTSKQEAVSAIYMVPTKMLSDPPTPTTPGVIQSSQPISKFFPFSPDSGRPSSFEGYTPKNNKLYTDPYMFCYAHNNNGSGAVYPFENWQGGRTPIFRVYGTIHGNPNFKIVPVSYKGESLAYDEGISLSGYPMCSWNYDTYKAWLAQSGTSTAISDIGAIAMIGAGAITALGTGGVGASVGAGMAISGITTVAGSLARRMDIKKQPPQSKGNALSGTANASIQENDFFIQYKTIKKEYAQIIDEFFSMYGYKVNRVKNIEFTSRTNWQFLQVNDLNVSGALPAPDLAKIKEVFANGITFWHNGANIGNYNLSNNPR